MHQKEMRDLRKQEILLISTDIDQYFIEEQNSRKQQEELLSETID